MQHFYKQLQKNNVIVYKAETELLTGIIYKDTYEWCFTVRFRLVEMDNKVITNEYTILKQHRKLLKKLKNVKQIVTDVFALIEKANTPGNAWIIRAVMMGAISENDFQYFAIEGQPK